MLLQLVKKKLKHKEVSYKKNGVLTTNSIDIKELKGYDISFELTPLISRTIDGRFKFLELLRNFGMQLTPQQVSYVVETGNLKDLTSEVYADRKELDKEVHNLLNGSEYEIGVYENHFNHIVNLLKQSSSKEVKKDNIIFGKFMAQVENRKTVWEKLTDSECKLIGLLPFIQVFPIMQPVPVGGQGGEQQLGTPNLGEAQPPPQNEVENVLPNNSQLPPI